MRDDVGVRRLSQQDRSDWRSMKLSCAAVLDRSRGELTAAFGWEWQTTSPADRVGMSFVLLEQEERSRFCLIASEQNPENGISLNVDEAEDPALARADFLAASGLAADVFLAVREDGCWFARWDHPHKPGERPATATDRHPGPGS